MIFTALIALIVFFQIKTGLAWTPTTSTTSSRGNAYILVLAIGMVLVIIAASTSPSGRRRLRRHRRRHKRDPRLGHPLVARHPCSEYRRPRPAPGRVSGSPTSASRPSSSPSPECSSSGEPTSGSASPSPCPCPGLQVIGAGSPRGRPPHRLQQPTGHPARHPGCAAIVFGAIRSRARLVKINAEVERPGSWTRLALICLVIMGTMLLHRLRSKGLPRLGPDPRRARPHLRIHLEQDRPRPPHLRRRRQPYAAGSGCEEQEDQLLRHVQHGGSSRPCRHDVRRAVHRLRPLRRCRLGADAIAAVFIGGAAVTGGAIAGRSWVVWSWPSSTTACRSSALGADVGHQGAGPARRPSSSTSTAEQPSITGLLMRHRKGSDRPPAATNNPARMTSSLSETTHTGG